jgi:hypothetical protein
LWIDKGNVETNEEIFQGLLAHKGEIEKAFGERLVWHRARGRSRAVQFFASRYGFDDRGRWSEIQAALIDAMIRLEAACSPYLYGEPPQVPPQRNSVVLEIPNQSVQRVTNVWTPRTVDGTSVVTMANLKAGIAEFKQHWPGEADFHNRLYRELLSRRNAGQLTWGRVVDELSAWGALRSSVPGRDKEWYLARGAEPFRRILGMVAKIQQAQAGRDPELTETTPEELQELFAVAVNIKGASSPMFASKLCHFVMPTAFPIADQAVLGISTIEEYWQYWRRCAEGWRASGEKEALKAELRDAMSSAPFAGYPWAAKIAELCHIGRSV